MTRANRRLFLTGSMGSAMAWSMRSAITGLPVSFLLGRNVEAAEGAAKIAVLSASGAGEAANVNGPGTYEPGHEGRFQHPLELEVDAGDVGNVVVQGTTLTAADLELGSEVALGSQTVRMARAYSALPQDLLMHLGWFQHRTNAGIHPQFQSVLRSHGTLVGMSGRGTEEFPSALAQETAALLGTATPKPFVFGDTTLTYEGSSMPRYTPTEAKTLAANVGAGLGGPENFDQLYDHFIDETYGELKLSGTPNQRRYLDRHASSRREALAFGEGLAELLEDITDDGIESQLKAAVAVAKLRLAPVIVTSFSFSGDNHGDADLTHEATHSLSMIRSLDAFWQSAKQLDVADDLLYATLTVFGRDTRRGKSGGRGHNGELCSGLILGRHVQGGVVGGIAAEGSNGACTGIQSSTGSSTDPDIAPADTLNAYYRTLMRLAGVPADRREARVPQGTEVLSLG